jgi:hypothetical protein
MDKLDTYNKNLSNLNIEIENIILAFQEQAEKADSLG